MSQNDAKADKTAQSSAAKSEAEKLATLKQLLFASEKAELAALRKQVEESGLTAEELGELLPKAVWKASSKDEQLSDALGPMFGTAIKSAIKNDADAIAEAISPIMGPAIRATIQQSIRGMVQSLNKTLEYSVSAKGLKWRWEALTTGKSFAEVVLLHTLRYRVVQVFLIDRETGLLIKHAAMDEAADNIDLASGMLTAIQDFVRDSFGASEDDSLSTMSFGNQTVWIETGAHAFLAAVIEGEAPESLRTMMQETVEQVHVRFADELDAYQGDSTPFAPAQLILDGCIVSAFEEDEKDEKEKETSGNEQRPGWQKALLYGAVAATLLGIFFVNRRLAYRNHIKNLRRQLAAPSTVEFTIEDGTLKCSGEARQSWIEEAESLAARQPGIDTVEMKEVKNLDRPWADYLAALQNEPGLLVTRSEARDGQYEVVGMRDPLASDPAALLNKFGLSPECVKHSWKDYQSLEPELVGRRNAKLAERLAREIHGALPATQGDIDLHVDAKTMTLAFKGTAPAEWVVAARKRAAPIAAGQLTLDFDQIVSPKPPTPDPTPQPGNRISAAELQRIIEKAAPNRKFVLFDPGSYEVTTARKTSLPRIAQQLHEILNAGKLAQKDIHITLVGTAARSDGAQAVELSRQRARAIWRELQKFDLPAANVLLQGIGTGQLTTAPPGFSEEMARRCCLIRIAVTPATQKP